MDKSNVVKHPATPARDIATSTTHKQTLERFAAWWARQGPDIQAGVREVCRIGTRTRFTPQADEVIANLNRLRDELGLSPFRYVDENRRLIRNRLGAGLSVNDLKAINAMKVSQIKDGTFDARYLRPVTLYNATRCEQYLAELPPRGGDEAAQALLFS